MSDSAIINANDRAGGRYVGRLAPSPTGLLHLGHARTFWIAAMRAQGARGAGGSEVTKVTKVTKGTEGTKGAGGAGGELFLRNDDLDRARCRGEFVGAMIEDLRWLGLRWREPMVSQSERISVYRAALGRLRAAGVIYPCKRSRRDVAEAVGAPHEGFEPAGAAVCNRRTGRSLAQSKIENLEFQMARFARPADSIRRSGADASDGDAMPDAHDEPIFPREWRPAAGAVLPELPAAGVAIASNWRFRVPDGEEVCFVDNALGAQRAVAGRDFGDFLVWRRDDLPSYQLACAVDDAEMGITEVVRGADLVKSAFRQILILRALGAAAPEYYHCALMHDAGGQRLAKRCDALALRTLRAQGVAPGEILRGFAATSSFSGLF